MDHVPVVLATGEAQVDYLTTAFPATPLAIRIPGPLVERLATTTVGALAATQWTFLIGGWSEPILAMLPETSRRAQLERELAQLRLLGIERLAGFVDRGWEPGLASLFVGVGLTEVFVVWPDDPPPLPVLADHLGDVVTVFAIGGATSPLVVESEIGSEGAVLPTELIVGRLDRREPPVDRGWVEDLAADQEGGLLYRKMLRLIRRLPERVPPEATEWLDSAQAAIWYQPGVDRRIAHAALAAARHRIDLVKRRPADWTSLSVVDWDADREDEVQFETPDLSLVLDPGSGRILYLDHKPSERSVTYLPDQAPWNIAQAMLEDDPVAISFELSGVEETRGRIGATLVAGSVELNVSAFADQVELKYRIATGALWQRLGPEMPFAFSGPIQVRSDGGPWSTVFGPLALSGHRFRLQHGTEQVLLTALQPADLFLRPVAGGVVVWANWALNTFQEPFNGGEMPLVEDGTSHGVEYRLTVQITA